MPSQGLCSRGTGLVSDEGAMGKLMFETDGKRLEKTVLKISEVGLVKDSAQLC